MAKSAAERQQELRDRRRRAELISVHLHLKDADHRRFRDRATEAGMPLTRWIPETLRELIIPLWAVTWTDYDEVITRYVRAETESEAFDKLKLGPRSRKQWTAEIIEPEA